MSNIDIYEIANYCVEKYKNSLSNRSDKKYDSSEFFAITDDNQVLYSATPHILKSAAQCIIMHKQLYHYIDYWNPSYDIEYIDNLGCVYKEGLGNGHRLSVDIDNHPLNLFLRFSYGYEVLYECKGNGKEHIPIIWKLYTRVKHAETIREKRLIADAFKKDQTILELEKKVNEFSFVNHLLEQERDQYKGMLDKIKQMMASKE